jgi:membrane protein DedA with SNARE-associated domain
MIAEMFSASARSLGYGFIFLATLLEFLGLPAPGGLLVALAGASLAETKLRLIPLICLAAVASTLGDIPWYFLGRFGGMRLLRGYCKFTLGSRFCVRNADSLFRRLGSLSLVVSKLVSGVRAFAAPVAGIQGYSFPKFLLLDLLGGVFWAAFFATTGRVIGPALARRADNRAVVVVTAVPFLVFLIFRIIRRALKGPAEEVLQSRPKFEPTKVPTTELVP